MKVKKIAKEQEIWNKEEEVTKFEEEAKKLIPQRFYKQIHILGKKICAKKRKNVSLVREEERRGA